MIYHWFRKPKAKSPYFLYWLRASGFGLRTVACSLGPVAWKRGLGGISLLLLTLALVVACGAAATATPVPTVTRAPAAAAPTATKAPVVAAPTPTRAPVAAPKPTPTPAVVKPAGTLNVGQKELGSYMGHPQLTGNPQIFLNSASAITESLVMHTNKSRELVPMLATAWSISSDFQVWTFKLRKGAQFHKGYGEMTAEDVVWSIKEFLQSKKHPAVSDIRKIFAYKEDSMETPDPYTIKVDTGVPLPDVTVLNRIRNPSAGTVWVTSKKQSEQLGAEVADRNIAATGPWEIVEHRTGEFWRMKAVEGHWRKTPFFAEMVLWEIPEEATRVAGFQTGKLDTFLMTFDSIPLVEKLPGVKLMKIPNAGESGLNFYGQTYVGIGTPTQQPNYDPNLPWVSANPDPKSPEWERAKKVRLALSLAIDRQAIVDTVLRGFARPSTLWTWAGHEDRLPRDMKWEFNPKRAKELLMEASYPSGFSLTLTPSIRGAPAETEACEVVGTMWRDIGIDVKLQKVPYETIRPQLIGRTYKGITCHAASPTLTPASGWTGMLSKSVHRGVWNNGVEHPWLDEMVPRAQRAVDPAERGRLELEIARFYFDNVLVGIGLYVFDSVWPVGPRVEEWTQHIRLGDTRNINGMEWAQHRKQQ